jgi:hypothetical protein
LIISNVGKSDFQSIPLGCEQSRCIEILREPVRLKQRVWEWIPGTRVVEYKIFGVNCIGYGVDLDKVLRAWNKSYVLAIQEYSNGVDETQTFIDLFQVLIRSKGVIEGQDRTRSE